MNEWKETDLGTIPNHWLVVNVDYLIEHKIIEKPLDGNHGELHPSGNDFVDKGIPFVMATDVVNGKVDLANCKFITEEQAGKLNKGFSLPGDVLLTHKASIGRTAIVGKITSPYIMLTPQVTYYRVINENKLLNKYLKYFFDSPVFQEILINHSDSGSTRAYIGITAQRELPILLPPLPEQRAIAAVLSSLDDKIDLLHRQNKTLEAMVETLFNEQFIMNNEEWKIGQVSDFIEFNPTRSLPKGTIAPYLEMANVNTSVFHPAGWYDREFSSGMKFINGDTLLARITPCLENGKSAYITFLNENQVGWGSTEFIVMRSKENLHTLFTYALARNKDFRDYAEGCLEGSSGRQRVNIDHLIKFEINVPPKENIERFNSLMENIEPKLHNNFIQIQTLTKLRDTLLPKLMS
ncbi:MAG TPA: restriction endonuclease subunit S, partial [Leptospiraceae bacterium]|nr:restriction endonuclease subunit S [Leptospiraceae bacterium]